MTAAVSRRTFLSATAGAAAVGLAGPAVRADGKAPANERLRLGVIGCGRRGRQLIPVFHKFDDVDIPVICDVNGQSMEEAHKLLGGKPERVQDCQEAWSVSGVSPVSSTTNWSPMQLARSGDSTFIAQRTISV